MMNGWHETLCYVGVITVMSEPFSNAKCTSAIGDNVGTQVLLSEWISAAQATTLSYIVPSSSYTGLRNA